MRIKESSKTEYILVFGLISHAGFNIVSAPFKALHGLALLNSAPRSSWSDSEMLHTQGDVL